MQRAVLLKHVTPCWLCMQSHSSLLKRLQPVAALILWAFSCRAHRVAKEGCKAEHENTQHPLLLPKPLPVLDSHCGSPFLAHPLCAVLHPLASTSKTDSPLYTPPPTPPPPPRPAGTVFGSPHATQLCRFLHPQAPMLCEQIPPCPPFPLDITPCK